jgi:hypothetical protein
MRAPSRSAAAQHTALALLAQGKARCRPAYDQARQADPRSAVLYDRWFMDTLLAVEG